MYGLIFDFLQQYVDASPARDGSSVRTTERLYFPITCYPDREFFEQIQALAVAREVSLADQLEDFGRFLTPRLMDYYRGLGGGEGEDSFDVLERADPAMHQMIRDQCPEANPPLLSCYRESPDLLVMHYQSERMLCHLARGIILGLAEHFGELLRLEEPQCIHRGDRDCVFRIRRV